MGGMTAQNFALKYPHRVKTLILLATSAYITNEMDILFEEYQKIMNELSPKEGFIKLIDLLFSESFIERLKRDKKLYQAVYEELMVKNKTRWQDYVNQAAAIRDHDTRDSLHEINQHTLIIHGTADKEVPFKHSEYLHANIPNSTLIPLEGFGHGNLLIEDFERINKIIWNFIEEHRD